MSRAVPRLANGSAWARIAIRRADAQARINVAARRAVRLEAGPEDLMELACALADLDELDKEATTLTRSRNPQ